MAAREPTEEANPPPQCTFFKKPPKSRNVRKRVADGEDDEDQGSVVIHKSKAARKGGFSTGGKSSVANDNEESGDGPGKNTFFYESSKEVQTQDTFATAALETETEFDKDARAMREKVLKAAEKRRGKLSDDGAAAAENKPEENKPALYKGMNAYTDHRAGFRRENSIAAEKAGGAHGPLRASAHIRMSARFDYQPDICKDYKETGYCGYGDSCKFLHDRGDYKSGWQLERDWEEAQQAKRKRMLQGLGEEEEEDKDDDDDDLPFACFICREPFVDPVVTPCKHYFCEHCALKHYMKSKSCFVCNKPTNGLFNTAHAILRRRRKQ